MTDQPAVDPAVIDRLRALRGIEGGFIDFRGDLHEASQATLRALLAAFGHAVGDASTLQSELESVERTPWTRVLPPVLVSEGHVRVPVTMIAPFLPCLRWKVQTEQGNALQGEWQPGEVPVVAEREFDGLWYQRVELDLPQVPVGYHSLEVRDPGGQMLGRTRLIVAPSQCYEPEDARAGRRVWGPAIQLYTLRSSRNWGIGDFTDLAGFAEAAAALGADLVGLNPLHALFPADPDMCSPYSPASRLFLNVLYIDPEAVPEFSRCEAARARVAAPVFQSRLAALRAAALVDYAGVTECKLGVLRMLFDEFESNAPGDRRAAFDTFTAAHSPGLERLAMYYALQSRAADLGTTGGWDTWPQDWQDPRAAPARAALEQDRDTVRFHCWLQWVADTQLAEARDRARRAGMRLGLYLDLAVGTSRGSAETWSDPALYAIDATIGAPPDPLALQGQDWGIPPIRPDRLQERAYEPFIQLLRANMQQGGALRIDHVMALARLWWVPAGRPSAEGSYVCYPLEDLLGIVALESQRNRCVVIGEDLGTVPPGFRDTLAERRIYSYRVLFFERDSDGEFLPPGDYPRASLATVTTHDLPTLASFWSGSDIDLRETLGVYAAPVAAEQRVIRAETRERLRSALSAAGLWPAGHSDGSDSRMSFELVSALQGFLAGSSATLLSVQPEDWLLMDEPVNVPGTHVQYPNWRRKMTAEWPALLAGNTAQALGRALSGARAREQPA